MSFSAAYLSAVLDAHTPPGATGLAVALSGGADSASLLIAASSLDHGRRGLPLRAVHVDHGLQPAARAFRRACAALCMELKVPLAVISANVQTAPGESLEAAARDARYAALQAELRPGECLLTAHHAQDQAETLLLQALRGAGLKGLSAMPVCRPLGSGWHLRPVLEVPQDELLAFGARSNAPCIRDPMNEDVRFDRNYLRREVWPRLEARWPGSAVALSRAARHAAEAQELLDRAAVVHLCRLRDGESLSVPGLRALAPGERINVLRFWLSSTGSEPPSTARLTEAVRQILDAQDDHSPVIVWGSRALRRYRQRVFVTDAEPPRIEATRPWRVEPGSRLDLGANLGTLCWRAQCGGLDADRLPRFLSVRRRDGGETLRPAPKAKTQTVQHLCQSYGVLPWMRDALPLVFADDALIAVADLWSAAPWRAAEGKPGLAILWDQAPVIV
jgi:tRNA(Ile)-lysidine synthase